MSFGFLKRTILPFSKIARNICDWCGLSCPDDPDDPEVVGPCCKDGNGTFLTQEECFDVGGEWLGPDKGLNDCKTGACCEVVEGVRSGNCAVLTRDECKNVFKGSWQGAGTNCEGRDCLAKGTPVLLSFVYQTQGTVCKCGFSDYGESSVNPPNGTFVGTRDPNRRWRTKQNFGNTFLQQWFEYDFAGVFIAGACNNDAPACGNWLKYTYGGSCFYSPEGPICGPVTFGGFGTEQFHDGNPEFFGGPDLFCTGREPSDVTNNCNLPIYRNEPCLVNQVVTPQSRTNTGTGECCQPEQVGANYYIVSGTWGEFLTDEDTLADAIARAEELPECPRIECDEAELAACQPCPYDSTATDCYKKTPGSKACTTSASGACYSASTVEYFVSLSGNTGGTVYVIIHDYPADDPDNFIVEVRPYVLESSGPDDATVCVSDNLEAGEGRCKELIGATTIDPATIEEEEE